jgi:hypothetical protein
VKHVVVAAFAFSMSAVSSSAKAQTERPPPLQWNASLGLGGATYGDSNDLWRKTFFAANARGELFFGRTSNRSFGFGPSAFVGLSTYTETNLGAGVQVLLPIHELLPLVGGIGLYGVNREDQKARTGAYASLGWGLRSYNYHSSYAMAGGLLLEARRDMGDTPIVTWLATAQLDAAALSLPIVWAINAFR